MKINNKGFMMAEVIVVSAIVMIVIVGLYQSYNKIYSAYNTRIDYYDSETLYRLGYYRDILIENKKIEEAMNKAKSGEVIDIYNSIKNEGVFQLPETEISNYLTDTVFFLSKNNFRENILDNKGISTTFKDYMKYLSTSTEFKSNYLMIMERCTIKDNKKDNDACKYGYLEIYDGLE